MICFGLQGSLGFNLPSLVYSSLFNGWKDNLSWISCVTLNYRKMNRLWLINELFLKLTPLYNNWTLYLPPPLSLKPVSYKWTKADIYSSGYYILPRECPLFEESLLYMSSCSGQHSHIEHHFVTSYWAHSSVCG